MKKNLIFVITLICLFISSTVVTYALFYFNSDTTIIKNIYVDPIKENYDFSRDKHMASDLFDVYFFPQSRYASAGFAKNDGKPESNKIFSGTVPNVSSITPDMILNYDPTTNTSNTGKQTKGEGLDFNARDVVGRYMEHDGYYDVTSVDKFKPIIKTVDGTLTIEILNSLPTVKSNMKDSINFGMGFSGWTASQRNAINMGYGGTGDFSLIEPNSSLYILDMITIDSTKPNGYRNCTLDEVILNPKIPGIDGSYCGDNKVFMYPIFTTGKNYQLDEARQLDCVRIDNMLLNSDPKSQQYLSLYKDTTFSGKAYVSKCINSLDSNMLHKLVAMEYKGYNWLFGHTWNGASINPNIQVVRHNNTQLTTYYNSTGITFNTLNLIPEGSITKGGTASNPTYKINTFDNNKSRLGAYNVYFYFCNTHFGPVISNGATYMPSGLNGKKISDIYYFNDSNDTGYKGWIYVEEIFDYKILGGNILSFDYKSLSAQIANKTNTEGTAYNAPNVPFLNVSKSFNYNYQGVSNSFGNGLFTVVPVSTNTNSDFINELQKYEVKLDDLSLNGDLAKGIEPSASYATPSDYKVNSQILKDNLVNKLIKVNKPGYYSISITISPETNPKTKVEKTITVNVKKTQPAIFVAIYGNKEDIKYTYDKNNNRLFIDFASMKAPLYVSDNVNVKNKLDAMNKQFDPNYDFKYVTLGDKIDLNTQFGKITDGINFDKATSTQLNNYTLESIFTTPVVNGMSYVDYGYNLYDAVTDLPVLEVVEVNGKRTVKLIETEPLMLRNRVFYIKKDPNLKPKI